VQAGVEPPAADPADPANPAAKPSPRHREPRVLATTGRSCGRCGGGGQIVGEAGFAGACPVCHGEGQVKTWDRSLKVR
jgi:DnaJ-class molecular chaperone